MTILDRIPDNPIYILQKLLNVTYHHEHAAGKEITGLKNLFPGPEISGVDGKGRFISHLGTERHKFQVPGK